MHNASARNPWLDLTAARGVRTGRCEVIRDWRLKLAAMHNAVARPDRGVWRPDGATSRLSGLNLAAMRLSGRRGMA